MPDADKNPDRVEEPRAPAYDLGVAGVGAARQLEQAGFKRDQADAVVLAVREMAGDLATKDELKFETLSLRNEIARLEASTKDGFAQLELRMTKAIHRGIMWAVGIAVGVNLGVVSIATAIILAASKS